MCGLLLRELPASSIARFPRGIRHFFYDNVRCVRRVCLQQLRGHAGRVDTHYFNSVDPKEAQKFAALSRRWWDPAGPFAPLHRFNFARAKFIRDTVCAMHGLDHAAPEPLAGLRVLDVGCGGGILSESMARMGAEVHGIDITEENVNAATAHAELDPVVRDRIRCVLGCGQRQHLVLARALGSNTPTQLLFEPA